MSFSYFRNRCILFAVSFLFIFVPASTATIRYNISIAHPEQHLFHVTMTISNVDGEVAIALPAWDALYQIRDFSIHVRQVEAFVDAVRVPIEKIDKQTWKIHARGTVEVRYATYWDEPGPFATQLNSEHAFVNAAMILMYLPERRAEDTRTIVTDVPAVWRGGGPGIQSEEVIGAARAFSASFRSYDELVDAPFELGRFEEFQLSGVNPPIRVIVHGDSWSKKKIEHDLKRICEYELKLMDGAPFENYTFIYHVGKAATGSGGGMEHANATAIASSSDEYLQGVSAHEFFHLWNVKRIRPASLEPVDYTKEQFTRSLWFAEGVTSTYGSFALVRSGLWSKQQFYLDLSEQINELEGRSANRWKSAEESSLDAWLEKYPLYNQADHSVSYYTKGQVLGDLLDILIRDRTDNEKSLDDVMRMMNSEFAKKGKPYRDSLDVRWAAEKVTGGSFESFFEKYVAGTEPFPYQEILGLAGLQLQVIEHKRAALGFSAERDSSRMLIVQRVEADSPAAAAGLLVRDTIVNWNGGEPPRSAERAARDLKVGDTLHLRVRRDDKLVNVDFKLDEVSEIVRQVVETAHVNEKARHIRDGLLRGVTSPVTVQR